MAVVHEIRATFVIAVFVTVTEVPIYGRLLGLEV